MSTNEPTPPSPISPSAAGTPARPEDVPYQLEPDADKPERGPKAKSGARKMSLDAPGLIDDFDEDADFDAPAPPRLTSEPAMPTGTAEGTSTGASKEPPFVKPSVLPIKAMIIAAGVVTLLSVIVGVRGSNAPWYAEVVLSLYHTLLHSVAGLVAVVFAARMASKDVGHAEVAFVRMVFGVALARMFFMLDIPIPFTDRVDELVLAAAGYCASVAVLFRLPKRDWQIVVLTQFALSMVLIVGASIETWHDRETPKVPPQGVPTTPTTTR